MCVCVCGWFKQEGATSFLSGKYLKLVVQIIYLGSNISSTESGICLRLVTAWNTINRLLLLWKSDLSEKIKRDFFQAVAFVDTTVWMHYMDAND